MTEKEYVCGYSKCLHHGEKVKKSEVVTVGKRHYHWDCATMKQNIKNCIDTYMDCIEDKTQFPIVTKIINNLVFNGKVPVDYVQKKIQESSRYYSNKPVYVLHGLKKLFWEKDFLK